MECEERRRTLILKWKALVSLEPSTWSKCPGVAAKPLRRGTYFIFIAISVPPRQFYSPFLFFFYNGVWGTGGNWTALKRTFCGFPSSFSVCGWNTVLCTQAPKQGYRFYSFYLTFINTQGISNSTSIHHQEKPSHPSHFHDLILERLKSDLHLKVKVPLICLSSPFPNMVERLLCSRGWIGSYSDMYPLSFLPRQELDRFGPPHSPPTTFWDTWLVPGGTNLIAQHKLMHAQWRVSFEEAGSHGWLPQPRFWHQTSKGQ